MTATADIFRVVRDEAQFVEIDLDAAHRSGWWHRPYTEGELDAHPDGERIRATIKVAIADAVERVCLTAASVFED